LKIEWITIGISLDVICIVVVQLKPLGIAVSDCGENDDVLWDVARGASSLMMSSLVVVSNSMALDVVWLRISCTMLGVSA
jgi:hypothetical protein